jgi:serine protease Do
LVLREKPKPNGPLLARRLFGVEVGRLPSQIVRRYGKLIDPDSVVVLSVDLDSPADNAGIEKGDIITMVDNTVIRDMDELGFKLEMLEGGKLVQLTLYRIRETTWQIERLQYERTLRTRSKSDVERITL